MISVISLAFGPLCRGLIATWLAAPISAAQSTCFTKGRRERPGRKAKRDDRLSAPSQTSYVVSLLPFVTVVSFSADFQGDLQSVLWVSRKNGQFGRKTTIVHLEYGFDHVRDIFRP